MQNDSIDVEALRKLLSDIHNQRESISPETIRRFASSLKRLAATYSERIPDDLQEALTVLAD